MRTKTVVILTSSISLVVLAFVGVTIWLAWRILSGPFGPTPTPALLKHPRIVIGAGVLTKQPFLQTSFLGEVTGKDSIGSFTDISVGEWDGQPGLDVIVAGEKGAYLLDLNGNKKLKTMFQFKVEKFGPFKQEMPQNLLGDVQVIDLEGDGKSEYLARGSIQGAALFNHEGKLIWDYGALENPQNGFVQDVAAGDLDGDGILELVASFNGVRIFDKDGNKLAQQDEACCSAQVEVVDVDGDGKNEIISSGATIRIRSAKGELIKEVDLPFYLSRFWLLKKPGAKESLILVIHGGILYFVDFNGLIRDQFSAPLSEFDDTVQKMPGGDEFRGTSVYRAKAVWVKLDKDQPEYLALVTNFAGLNRGVFDVFDVKGKLIYQEVVDEDCDSIAALPTNNATHPQQLLVGGESTVWRYGKQ